MNFVGVEKEHKVMFSQYTKENAKIASTLLTDSTQWRFNPPAAPHMGSKWEAVVK